jgi:hypothetical protein
MANMVVKNSYGAPQKQILVADETAVTFGAQIGNAGVSAGSDGRKIVKAGTPLYGDLLDRDTAFVVATQTEAAGDDPASNNANAVLLHDVDVTAGDANGTIISTGHIDRLKLDSDVQALLTAEARAALKAEGIKFINGSQV